MDLTTRKVRRYFPDFVVKVRTESGRIEIRVLEIKPAKESPYHTLVPMKGKKTEKRHITEVLTWHKNKLKWHAAEEFCKARGWRFQILTEHELKLLS
jgi:hypothetical protein